MPVWLQIILGVIGLVLVLIRESYKKKKTDDKIMEEPPKASDAERAEFDELERLSKPPDTHA